MTERLRAHVDRQLRAHMLAALVRAGRKPGAGTFRFSDIEGKPVHVGRIQRRDEPGLPDGSMRYGDTIAVPTEGGETVFAYAGAGRHGAPLIVSRIQPEEYDESLIRSELEAMWRHVHRDFGAPGEYQPTRTANNVYGPVLDMERDSLEEVTGRIDRWFYSSLRSAYRVHKGDYAEFRVRSGKEKGSVARIEAGFRGFLLLLGRSVVRGEDRRVEDWRLLWASPGITGLIDYLYGTTEDRRYMESVLSLRAQEMGGLLRYSNGYLNGVVPTDRGYCYIRNWCPAWVTDSGITVDPAVDVREVLGLGVEVG